jgi:hypothetical protein
MAFRRREPRAPLSARDRLIRDVRQSSGRGGRIALASGLISVGLFLLVFFYSAYQVTEPRRAQHIIERGVAALFDIDAYLDETLPGLRDADDESTIVEIPGLPLPVALPRDELENRDDEEIRGLILQRSAALIYADGLAAFDVSGQQSIGLFTAENVVENFLEVIRGSTHTWSGRIAIILAFVVAISTAVVAASDFRPGVLRVIGGAMFGGAIGGLLVSFAIAWLVGRIDGDPFTADSAAIARDIFEVPRRNFLVVSVFSGVLFAVGAAISYYEKRAYIAQQRAYESGFVGYLESQDVEAAGEYGDGDYEDDYVEGEYSPGEPRIR